MDGNKLVDILLELLFTLEEFKISENNFQVIEEGSLLGIQYLVLCYVFLYFFFCGCVEVLFVVLLSEQLVKCFGLFYYLS